MSQFNQPAAGDAFNPGEHPEWQGKLLLIYPDEYIQGITTKTGRVADAVSADIVFLDHYVDGALFKLSNTMIFPKVMVGQTKGSLGAMVLGRLGQGANTKGNPPWLLLDHTPEDERMAEEYLAQNPVVQQPSGPPTSSGSPAPATGGQSANPWDAALNAPAAPAATQPPAAPTAGADPLVEFLVSKGYDRVKLTALDNDTLKMLAATAK